MVRRAGPGDASTLAALGRRTFQATFGPDNDPADMRQYLDETFAVDRISRELGDPESSYFLAFRPGGVGPAGYAKLRSGGSSEAVVTTRPIELQRIYVDATGQRTGIGSALMQACMEEARSGGFQTICWVSGSTIRRP